jgi:hypothetical protein
MARPRTRSRSRPFRPLREVVIVLAGLAFGAVALPAAIYLVGNRTLGAYGGEGPGAFAAKLYGDLVHLEPPALLLTLTPLAALYIFRLLWRALRPG